MQFLFLLHGDEAAELALEPEERRAIIAQHMDYSRMLRGRGVLRGGDALEPSTAAAVVRDGIVSDGPFAETKEQLGGYYLVEVASRDEAVEYARQVPASPGLVVEVRPVIEM